MSNGEKSTYVIGQGNAATSFFSQRTAQGEVSYMVSYISPESKILDVGCGPGSITCDFAALAKQGHVTGVDISPVAVEKAKQLAKDRQLSNVDFRTGDVLKGLDFPDSSFDIITSHQMLVHISDPVTAMKEMKRLVKPGGIVAFRESFKMLWSPTTMLLDRYYYWFQQAIQHSVGSRYTLDDTNFPGAAVAAGFDLENTITTVTGKAYSSPKKREEIVQRMHMFLGKDGSVRPKAIAAGAPVEELDNILRDVEGWSKNPNAWMSWLSYELVYTK